MKLLFSLFMLPAILTTVIAAIAAMFLYLDAGGFRPDVGIHSFWSHFYFAMLHLSMIVGLILSILTSIYAAAMCLIGFIIKTWLGAILAGGIAVFSFLIMNYLMNTVI